MVPKAIDPATLPFQALRMAVNHELDELVSGLFVSQHLLRAGGVLVVVSYHSIEDRVVKKFIRFSSKPSAIGLNVEPSMVDGGDLVRPSESEIVSNPRASSALMRWCTRTTAPPVELMSALESIALKRPALQ